MEDEFLSLGLDIIGLGVFNYDFGSVTKESPVIKAVYRCLNEAVRCCCCCAAHSAHSALKPHPVPTCPQEHRATFYLPYWNIPGARFVVPRLREFHRDLDVLDAQLNALIRRAVDSKQEDDLEALQARDYSKARTAGLVLAAVSAPLAEHVSCLFGISPCSWRALPSTPDTSTPNL